MSQWQRPRTTWDIFISDQASRLCLAAAEFAFVLFSYEPTRNKIPATTEALFLQKYSGYDEAEVVFTPRLHSRLCYIKVIHGSNKYFHVSRSGSRQKGRTPSESFWKHCCVLLTDGSCTLLHCGAPFLQSATRCCLVCENIFFFSFCSWHFKQLKTCSHCWLTVFTFSVCKLHITSHHEWYHTSPSTLNCLYVLCLILLIRFFIFLIIVIFHCWWCYCSGHINMDTVLACVLLLL